MLPLALGTFLGFGFLLVLVGAHQAELSRALDLTLSESALLGASLAFGAGIGITAAGPAYDRLPRRPLFAGAALVVAVALGTAHDGMTAPGAFARIAIAGIGGGAYNTAVNAAVGSVFAGRSGRALAMVHATATAGAMIGPLCFDALAGWGGYVASFRLLGAYHLAIALAAWLAPWEATPASQGSDARLAWGDLAPYLALSCAYVGVEAVATLFAVPRAQALGLDPGRGRLAISAFWAGVLASRVGLMTVSRLATGGAMVAAGVATATAAALPLWLIPQAIELSFAATGIAVGLVYPLTLSLVGERFAQARGTATGMAGGAAAAGGFLAPWLAGVAGDTWGTGASLGLVAALGLAIATAATRVRTG